MMTYSWGVITIGAILSVIQYDDMTMLIIGFLLAIVLPIAVYNDLSKKVIKRERLILLELPELLNKIILLVGAGSTVQQVISQCLRRRENQRSHPLYKELFQMQKDWEAGYSFQQALEAFSKRCGVQEVSVFSTTLLLNYRRGGQDFVLALKELSHSLWEKRKAVSKTLGEQASSKLVFPMVFIFIALIILIGSPAFMIMNF
jgi:tight adherence protein C